MNNKFYITTPIYYATAKPHIGSLYSTIAADVIARWHQLHNKDVFFLTGTDEHGSKIAHQAEKADISPQALVDKHAPEYSAMWHRFGIEYSAFIRTTNSLHKTTVQKIILQLIEKGDVYEGFYEGWYCTPCETFIVEKENEKGKQDVLCSSCQRTTHFIKEKSYFFAVSKYQKRLVQFLHDNPDWIIPSERAHEIISFLEQPLRDLSISRTNVTWGIPFPTDATHTLYVWIEALCNYITALEYCPQTKIFAKPYWPANIHILGKDIIRFHGIYWPILLMALDLPLPENLLVHGWIKTGGQKMSKSLNNVIDPDHLLQHYDKDVIRYTLIRYAPFNQDSEFSVEVINRALTADLADDLGNLLQRMLLLAKKYHYTHLKNKTPWNVATIVLQKKARETADEIHKLWQSYELHLAYAHLWTFIKTVNAFFHEQAPWQVIKKNAEQFEQIIAATSHSLLLIAYFLWPLMPQKVERILHALGFTIKKTQTIIEKLLQGVWHESFTLEMIDLLFPKPLTTELETPMIKHSPEEKPIENFASLDDLARCHIAVGTITACAPVEKSTKLFMLTVNCGTFGMRQILTNIRQFYKAEELINRQALFMLNLKPRTLMGLTSEGMILCVHDASNKPILLSPATAVLAGSSIS